MLLRYLILAAKHVCIYRIYAAFCPNPSTQSTTFSIPLLLGWKPFVTPVQHGLDFNCPAFKLSQQKMALSHHHDG